LPKASSNAKYVNDLSMAAWRDILSFHKKTPTREVSLA
jgi:hypothetical protein